MKELLDIMLQRRSIRNYTDEEIPEDKLEKIIQAGLLAPTSRNRRPCEFYIVRDKEALNKLSTAKETGAELIKDADTAIAVFADPDKADTWVEDSSIALSYMNLMAVDQGVGSCWVQMHLREDANGNDSENICREIFDAPERYRIVGILALGMPAEDKEPSSLNNLDQNKIHMV